MMAMTMLPAILREGVGCGGSGFGWMSVVGRICGFMPRCDVFSPRKRLVASRSRIRTCWVAGKSIVKTKFVAVEAAFDGCDGCD